MRLVMGTVLLLVSCLAELNAQGRPLALDDYYRLESASAPAISPDGRWVAFVRGVVVEAENRRRTEIWLALSDGSAPAWRITHPGFSASDPRWSPDGALLAFSSRRGGGGDDGSVWFLRMDVPQGEAFRIPGVEGTPVWSPDGRWIAFTKPTPPSDKPVTAAESDGDKRIRERFKGRIAEWMNYRFDGRGYLPDPRDPAATPPRELYLVPRDGGTPRRITSFGVDVRDPAWRPDGRMLAFVADSFQREEHSYERADLWTVTVDGAVTRLTNDGHDHGSPAWSPDGRWLVVQRELGLTQVIASRQDHGAPVDLYRLPTEGGPMRNLTPEWDLLPGGPTVSPDGKFVYFSGGVGGGTHLFRAPADGGTVEPVTTGDRRLTGFTFSAAFAWVAYTAVDPTHPAEVFVARRDGREERRLSSFNDSLLREIRLAPAERVAYRSADGTEIEGWVLRPAASSWGQGRGGRLPLILSIHGGPHGAYGWDFNFQFQLWAANGYLVLYTNPRGSTGYGERFLWGTWGAWGDRDLEDVLAGVDHVLARYPADPGRLGVSGYSYGGFLTNWAITHTTRFAAAVSGAGISNWLSDYGTADIPRTKESEFYGTPWEQRGAETLWRQSPIKYAGATKTPTLFVHGEADLRVPIEQAEQMYTALRKNRIPARFIRYPDMYHGGWTPWNTVHRYHEELAWWDRWLRRGTTP
jgi:dipeptidyl aminopeptidase/acylaminoacyl peptidase